MNLERFYNWKKYPASVWYVAGPLALLGFSLHLAIAVLKFKQDGDPWFLVIFAAAIALLVFALWPIRKYILRSNASLRVLPLGKD